jgi:UPF0716 family protein affecting phage T7 exclusion
MLSRIRLLCLLIVVLDTVLLALMIHYTSWLFMLSFVFISGLVGAWLIGGVGRHLRRFAGPLPPARANSSELQLWGLAARLFAGVLFIVPGVLTDIMALMLISPWGKWLVRSLAGALSAKIISGFAARGYSVHLNGEMPVKDQIIDVRVVDGDDKDEERES